MGARGDHNPDISRGDLADISARADGTLDPARRAGVDERIAASPDLQALYESERRVVELLHEARASTRAPASLRARIEAERERAARRARGLPIRPVYGGALAAALAVVALALVLVAPAGTPGAPSVSQAASLATRAAPRLRRPVPTRQPGQVGAQRRGRLLPELVAAALAGGRAAPAIASTDARRRPSTTSGGASGSPTRSSPRPRCARRPRPSPTQRHELRTLRSTGGSSSPGTAPDTRACSPDAACPPSAAGRSRPGRRRASSEASCHARLGRRSARRSLGRQ